jgi:AAA domain
MSVTEFKQADVKQGLLSIVAMVVSPVGGGKTGMLGSFPRLRILDLDGRAHRLLSRLYPTVDITYAQFKETVLDGRGIIKNDGHFAFDDVCVTFDKWVAQKDQWDTLALDTATVLSDYANNKAIVLNGKHKLSSTYADAMKDGVVIPKIQDFGSERSLMEQFVAMVTTWCIANNKHFLFMCHEKEDMNDAGSVTAIKPLLTGKGAVTVPGNFSEVWWLRSRKTSEGGKPAEIQRYLQTTPDGLRTCRSDLGVPDGTLASYTAIMQSLKRPN